MLLMYGVFAENGNLTPALAGVNRQLAQQPRHLRRPPALEHVVEGIKPLADFNCVELRGLFRSNVSHWTHVLSLGTSSYGIDRDDFGAGGRLVGRQTNHILYSRWRLCSARQT